LQRDFVLERGGEKFPDANPRLISDNTPLRFAVRRMTTLPYYPQNNRKNADT